MPLTDSPTPTTTAIWAAVPTGGKAEKYIDVVLGWKGEKPCSIDKVCSVADTIQPAVFPTQLDQSGGYAHVEKIPVPVTRLEATRLQFYR